MSHKLEKSKNWIDTDLPLFILWDMWGKNFIQYQITIRKNYLTVSFSSCSIPQIYSCKCDGILPKGPYLPCLCMADRALLAGYPRNMYISGQCSYRSCTIIAYIEGILPKQPYLPCVSMAGRALLAGYHRHIWFHCCLQTLWHHQVQAGYKVRCVFFKYSLAIKDFEHVLLITHFSKTDKVSF